MDRHPEASQDLLNCVLLLRSSHPCGTDAGGEQQHELVCGVSIPSWETPGYLIYELGVTPVLVETKPCRPPLSTLWINSKWEKNSQS